MASALLRAIQFSAVQSRLRRDWFELVETPPDEWEEVGAIGGTESKPVRVINRAIDLSAVAKPGATEAASDRRRAAHEKLAYDLSYLVSLPLCPVVLWGRTLRLRTNSAGVFLFGPSPRQNNGPRLTQGAS
jgi:hypothetical protein